MGRENFQTEWVQRAREQDQEALEALYVFCYGEVYATIREATGADRDTIKDILQETYIRAFTKLDTLIDDSKFQNGFIRLHTMLRKTLCENTNRICLIRLMPWMKTACRSCSWKIRI